MSYTGTVVDCFGLGLTALPNYIPLNTARLSASFNDLRNITHMPRLPQLSTLYLTMNNIESLCWGCLRGFPVLVNLFLRGNRLQQVKLDSVIEHLPKLKLVDFSDNKIKSLSQSELGWPQVKDAWINDNPFHCDCDLFWLIEKMACLEACKGGDEKACCLSCSACFLASYQNVGVLACKFPSQFRQLPLSEMSNRMANCEPTSKLTTTITASAMKKMIYSIIITRYIIIISIPDTGHTASRGQAHTTVDCKYQGLPSVPHDIPPNADRVNLVYNAITTVNTLPHLPQLYSLDLSDNSIETVVWESLCNLPALGTLYMCRNRLQYVRLDAVIQYLPKLRECLGWPQITSTIILENPSPCDCTYHGLNYRTCAERGADKRCSSCSACFFVSGRKREDFYCKRPDEASQPHSANGSTHLAECERQRSMTRATTTEVDTTRATTTAHAQRTLKSIGLGSSTTKDEPNPLQPTARATTTVSVMMDTKKAKINASEEKSLNLFINGSYLNITPTLPRAAVNTTKTPDIQFISLTTAPTHPTQTGISKSSPSSTGSNGRELSQIVYISIFVVESALTLMFISCFVRLVRMRGKMGRNRRQGVSMGPSIPLQQISPPIPNSGTQPTGGSNHEHLTAPSVDEHSTGSEDGGPYATTTSCNLYTPPPDGNSANNSAYTHKPQQATSHMYNSRVQTHKPQQATSRVYNIPVPHAQPE
ncbi:hypothetical protein Bbelb_054650 [Branchiostoma belcheri]|nr:hypothetical protein Bbelb_054650 [Branchiostoma belcheri]